MSLREGKRDTGVRALPPPTDLSGEFRKYIGKQVSYATHGIHRYPAKFIPQVPRFCLESHSKPKDVVLDPFMGSGTTLLESYMLGRDCYGIDIHPLARLIAKVKTTPIEPSVLADAARGLLERIEGDEGDNGSWIPEIPNREHWFKPEVLEDLATIKKHIWSTRSVDLKDFFKICMSSIIRRVSNSDSDSLIPEVTSFRRKLDAQGKTSFDAKARFRSAVRNKLIDAEDLWKVSHEVEKRYGRKPHLEIVGNDARDIRLDESSVCLAITSPPYASAVHYASVHKLEMYWLGLIKDHAELDSRVIGTARAYLSEYGSWNPDSNLPELKDVLDALAEKDRKSGFIVHKYFEDMRKNLSEVNRVLMRKGRYCMVVGENSFRKIRIPTYSILGKLAQQEGFSVERVLSYDIINRHLDVPRWNKSTILKDYVLVMRKG